MPTPRIFDYDNERLAHDDPGAADRHLAEYPALFVNHLEVALWIEGWATRLGESDSYADSQGSFDMGFEKALREIVAHLRQGDFLPGGALLDEC